VNPAVAIFLKAPRLGKVKTRLAAEIGDRQALRLYRLIAARTLAAVRESGLDATIWYAPAGAGPELRYWLGEEWALRPQASGELGARLAASTQAVQTGRGWIAVGGDCPALNAAHIHEASVALERGEIVIGPTQEGGYYLWADERRCPTSSPPCRGAASSCWRRRSRGSSARECGGTSFPRCARWTPRPTHAPKDS
jgi:glycosyltransferase A (GT-A) superfamily protein (DUF2064 family)